MTTQRKRTEIHARLPEDDFKALKGYIGAGDVGELETLSDVVRIAISEFLHNHGKPERDEIQKQAELTALIQELQLEILGLKKELALKNNEFNTLSAAYKNLSILLAEASVPNLVVQSNDNDIEEDDDKSYSEFYFESY